MRTQFLWTFSCLVLLDAAHIRQDRAYGESDPVCPLLSCYADFGKRGFYRPQPITPELFEECSGATAQLQQCVRDTFQNDGDAICQTCRETTVRRGLQTNGTNIHVLEKDCPQVCDNNEKSKQCSKLCHSINRDVFHGRLQAQDMSRVLACDECQQELLNRCPTSRFIDPMRPVWHARAVLVINGCQLPDRRRHPCNLVDFYGQEACRGEDLPEQLTQFLNCVDQDIAELPQCDGIEALHLLELNAALHMAADSCPWVEAGDSFRREKCST